MVRDDSEASTISDVAGLDYTLGASAQCFEWPQCFDTVAADWLEAEGLLS